MARETLLTAQGLQKLQDELDHLQNVRMAELAQRIKVARELGDLSENSDYHDAKNEQGLVASKIREIEDKIRTARVVEHASGDVASVGTRVTVDEDGGGSVTYELTGAAEANPLEFKVSYESPIGSALLNHGIGDTVTAQLPRGELTMTITAIEPVLGTAKAV